MKKLVREQLSRLAENPIQWDCPLAPFTTFGIGGPAEALIVVESVKELSALLHCFADNSLNWRFLGKGSNLLVADSGFAGAVLLFGQGLAEITLVDDSEPGAIRVRVGAGCSLGKLLNWCVGKGYSGLEFVSGIPGSLGGAVVMNAGAWGGEIEAVVDSLTVFSMTSGEELLSREELEFDYRRWVNQKVGNEKRLVVSADIRLAREDAIDIQERCRKYLQQRKIRQPKVQKNAGSFFRNPPGDSAGRLIDASGCKGKCCGGAMVSPVHANFLVNTGDATADDVKQLMEMVVNQVYKDTGIILQPEVHFL
ncbi:MAG: UDP-N-acetylmuramate dehydrogenase [Desulfocapsa sp.]|nr:UDP-N-acetylmuramate dehydrogenase [Desulfocapsa sp.]